MLNDILIPVLIFAGLAIFAGVSLSICSKIFAVKTDERFDEIREALPGLNCGVCGFSGCDSYAAELVGGDVPTNKCVPGGDGTSKVISSILGTDYEDVIETIAFVKCNGTVPHATSDSYIYQGEPTCIACNLYYQGKGHCGYGCIGYGDCVKKCAYGAIRIEDEIAVIDPTLCKGCTMCVAECPKHLISMRDATKKVFVRCSSCNNGKLTIARCNKGCIGCSKCVKVCPSDAIVVKDNLASIDYSKCTGCMECVKNCPKRCIEVM